MGIPFNRVAGASEYLAITGLGIADVKLAKKAWLLPGQVFKRFGISPVNYELDVDAMSAEKLPFVLPAVFTIGPRADDRAALLLYAKLVAPHDSHSDHVKTLVQGVVEGETRVLAASMTMEEIFTGAKTFKQAVFDKVQLELNQFGLIIYNANVKQLVDVPGHEYFFYLGQKTQTEAANEAKVDVAEARMKGDVGAKERDGHTKQNAARVEAETKAYAKHREGEWMKEQAWVAAEVQIFESQRRRRWRRRAPSWPPRRPGGSGRRGWPRWRRPRRWRYGRPSCRWRSSGRMPRGRPRSSRPTCSARPLWSTRPRCKKPTRCSTTGRRLQKLHSMNRKRRRRAGGLRQKWSSSLARRMLRHKSTPSRRRPRGW